MTDVIIHQVAQGTPVEIITGVYVTPVTDTILDLICNFFGAVIFSFQYLIHRKTNKNLLIGNIVKDFYKNNNIKGVKTDVIIVGKICDKEGSQKDEEGGYDKT